MGNLLRLVEAQSTVGEFLEDTRNNRRGHIQATLLDPHGKQPDEPRKGTIDKMRLVLCEVLQFVVMPACEDFNRIDSSIIRRRRRQADNPAQNRPLPVTSCFVRFALRVHFDDRRRRWGRGTRTIWD